MEWLFTPAAGVLFSAAALSLLAAWLVWSRRAVPGGRILFGLLLTVSGYTFVTGMEAVFVPVFWKTFWARFEVLGVATVATLLLLFAARYTGRDRWLHGWRRYAIWALPILNFTGVATNHLHHLMWAGFLPGPAGANTLVYVHGPLFYAAIAGLYLYFGTACVFLVGAAARPELVRRRQALTILGATLFPFVAGILYVFEITPLPGLDMAPIACFFSVVVIIIAVSGFRVLNLVPVARDVLVEGMLDAVLVVDADRRLVDLNPAARRLLGVGSEAIGGRVEDVVLPWATIEGSRQGGRDGHVELELAKEPLLYVDIRVSPLVAPARRPKGLLVVLRDITDRRVAEANLEEANRRLEADVARIEALQTELREQAIRDSLTGLFNRRFLDEVLPRTLQRAAHDAKPLSVVMIDIDHFKQVNDQLGHEEGDRVLERLGRLLRERTRPGDVACRYGGEEFVLVMPEAPIAAARARAESLLAEFALETSRSGRAATLSAGVATFPAHAETQDGLLRAADAALYAAKLAGRNCVRTADGSAAPEAELAA